jgi:hypothetical protein
VRPFLSLRAKLRRWPTETQPEKLKKQENERDSFCVVSDAFRLFARRSAIAQLVHLEDFSDKERKMREKKFQSMHLVEPKRDKGEDKLTKRLEKSVSWLNAISNARRKFLSGFNPSDIALRCVAAATAARRSAVTRKRSTPACDHAFFDQIALNLPELQR